MTEILAPAGNMERLRAAVFGGADGVYLGYKDFSARQSAENFSGEELREAVLFCHERNVKVYVAVNTLVKGGELSKIVTLAKDLSQINVDGVIVQDLAVAEIFRSVSPSMPLHGSTQMAIHNLEGAKTLKEMGFSRVVLARELTFEEIEKITSLCGIETEVFVHGAHCMSASGMCYLSSFIGGRSGNRGRCAQPCRLDFKSGKDEYCLSLKDMCYVDYVEKLSRIGVASLKIEGRMKRAEYAYMASKTYKKTLLGENTEAEMSLLRGIFSRSGFTDGYIRGDRNKNMFGYRRKEDVEASASSLKAVGKMEEEKKLPVSVFVDIEENKPLKLTVSSLTKSVSAFSEEILTRNTLLPSAERIESAIRKTGSTPFFVGSYKANIDFTQGETDRALSVSAINSMRREAFEKLSREISKREEKEIKEYVLPEFELRKDKKIRPEIRIRLEKAEQAKEISDFFGKIIIPFAEAEMLGAVFEKENIILEVDALVYPFDEEKVFSALSELKKKGYKNVICENISFIKRLKEQGFVVYGGAYLNVTNVLALKGYEKLGVEDLTLSIEINNGEIPYLSNSKIGVLSYGFLPLMHFRVCPLKASVGCERCRGNGTIKDRLGKEFPVLCKKRYVSLLNTVPLSLSGKELRVDFQTLYFTKETPMQVKDLLKQFTMCVEPDYPHTKGLYFRKVL